MRRSLPTKLLALLCAVERVRRRPRCRPAAHGANRDPGVNARRAQGSGGEQGRPGDADQPRHRQPLPRRPRRKQRRPRPLQRRPHLPPPPPKPSGPSIEEIVKPVNSLQSAIEAAEKNLEQSPGSQRDLAALRTGIEKIENNAREAADNLRKPLDEVRSQIAKLGAPPAANEPPEEPDVAAERQRLNGIAAQIDGAIKKASLIEVRARQLIARVQSARQGVFTRFLFRQTDTPLQWRVWQQAGDQLHLARRQISFILTNWWSVAKLNTLRPARRARRGAAQLLRPQDADGALDPRQPRHQRPVRSRRCRSGRRRRRGWRRRSRCPAAAALLVLYVGPR